MSDLISREAVIDAIFSEPLYKTGMKKRDADAVVPAIYEKIKSLPSAQPEIIRCKDCRWRDDYGHWLGCPVLNTDDDNFCSMAERRTDDPD